MKFEKEIVNMGLTKQDWMLQEALLSSANKEQLDVITVLVQAKKEGYA